MKNAKVQMVLLFVLMVSLIVGTSIAGASATQDELLLQDLAQSDPACALDVEIVGGGSLNVLHGDQQASLLGYVENEVAVSCGETVTLTAIPRERWRFVGWEAGASGSEPIVSYTVNGQDTVRARFAAADLRLVPLDEPVEFHGQAITESAIPNPDWETSVQLDAAPDLAEASDPVIDVWYGTSQKFVLGPTQKWINILGNISDDNNITSVVYSLNGGSPVNVVLGTGSTADRRLAEKGDFNIEIATSAITQQFNELVITATDSTGGTSQTTVNFEYNVANGWSFPYSVNWNSVNANTLLNKAQIVDGDWQVESGGLRTSNMAYDRAFAIGGVNWQDMEIIVPVTYYGTDPGAYNPVSVHPGMGIIMRWQGHTPVPNGSNVSCPADTPPPHCYWQPSGAWAWYDFGEPGQEAPSFALDGKKDASGKTLEQGKTYMWKVRVETQPDNSSKYAMKVWDPAVESEPSGWLVQKTIPLSSNYLASGSLLLVAHHVDAKFGNIAVVDLTDDTEPPIISNVQASPGQDRVTITWDTDEPADSRVDIIGGSTVTDPVLVLNHSLTATGLTPDKEYKYIITSKDAAGNESSSSLRSFTTLPEAQFVSDDFNYCGPNLDPIWKWVDPLNDASYSLNGESVSLTVPAGTAHDIWPDPDDPSAPINRAPRIMQDLNKLDDMIVKFNNGLSETIQVQGIVIEQDGNNMVRANFQYQDGKTSVFVSTFVDGTPKIIGFKGFGQASANGPLFMRVEHNGDQWKVSYSTNGSFNDTNAIGPFTFSLGVKRAGVFVGNSVIAEGGLIPEHTAVVDFAFNGNSPIDPEDGTPNFLPVNIVGHGKVTKDKECGNPVKLTAVPDSKWDFLRWDGSTIDGATDPVQTVTFARDDVVTANFKTDSPQYALNINVNNVGEGVGGTVSKDPNYTTYLAGDVINLLAEPQTNWKFTGWSGDLTGTTPSRSFTMPDREANVTATFTQDRYKVNTTIVGQGQVLKDPNKTDYAFGEQVTLTAIPAAGYAFSGWSGGLQGNPVKVTVDEELNITATFVVSAGVPQSDDFNSCDLKGFWTEIDPRGDSTIRTNGEQVIISVPATQTHTLWEGVRNVPRIMQDAEDINFEYEAKFDSSVDSQYQMQGILIERDANDYMRIEVLNDDNSAQAKVFIALFKGGKLASPVKSINTQAFSPSVMGLKVGRNNDTWTVYFSADGSPWRPMRTFDFTITVRRVGVYAGNDTVDSSIPPPAHTAIIDYFFNNANPIFPEDGNKPGLEVNVVGNGNVSRDKQPPYVCGDRVQLFANPAPNWFFGGWSGDAGGRANPLTVDVEVGKKITATFTTEPPGPDGVLLPFIVRP